ncbi:MAG: hypothetical protein RMK89_04195 [Armatimonadota bacterium]|nr:hypothetical protein [Armatimonadota bacterium]MDW8142647.1 hypothetical protein [Armatimonadota bacterium]
MSFPTRVVFNVLTDESGKPLVGVPVKAYLLLPQLSRRYQAEELPRVVKTQTDDNGRWELSLVPNDVLNDPQSFYVVEEGEGQILHQHLIRLPSGESPVWIGDIALPEIPKCSPQIIAILNSLVTTMQANNDSPMKGDIRLKDGTEINLETNYADREIIVHGRLVTGEKGITVRSIQPYERRISPTYGETREMRSIAVENSSGTVDKFARIDHTHKGVHSVNNIVGDVSILADVGIKIVKSSSQIFVANEPHQVLYGKDFEYQVVRNAGGVDVFNLDLGAMSFVAVRTDNNQDVTETLTDNNVNTYVTLNEGSSPPVRVKVILPRAMPISHVNLLPYDSSSSFSVSFYITSGNELVFVYSINVGSGSGWQQIPLFKNKVVADTIIVSALMGTAKLSEFRVNVGMVFKGVYAWSSGGNSSEVVAMKEVYLRGGFRYKWRAFFGLGNYLPDQYPTIPECYATGILIYPNGGSEIFRSRYGFPYPKASPPFYNELRELSGVWQIPESGWHQVIWILDTRPAGANFEHIYLLGMLLGTEL